ncbi:hypothetical protein CDL15_Pgr018372 [Punica granatum]|uniref:Uncharacterized protein n=1 Tax=Punica granatum TaxID=22663 RepID=A0A218WJ88_PUNGR|nr:hypothetical protein CDL15_Pgr018372 [Punica granatum]
MDSGLGKFKGSTVARGEAQQQDGDDKESRRTLQQWRAQEARGSNSGEQHSSRKFEGSPEVRRRELGPCLPVSSVPHQPERKKEIREPAPCAAVPFFSFFFFCFLSLLFCPLLQVADVMGRGEAAGVGCC